MRAILVQTTMRIFHILGLYFQEFQILAEYGSAGLQSRHSKAEVLRRESGWGYIVSGGSRLQKQQGNKRDGLSMASVWESCIVL